MFRFGLIGTGHWGSNYITTLSDLGFPLVRTCSKTPKNLPGHTTDYMEVCSDPNVDVVIIATPPNTHYSIAHFALDRGKHVICEKPFVFSSEKARELQALAKDRAFIVNYIHLWQPGFQKLVQDLDHEPTHLLSEGVSDGPFRDYHPLWDWGSHDIALCVSLKGKPRHQACFSSSKENAAMLTIRLDYDIGNAWIYCGNLATVKRRSFVARTQFQKLTWEDNFREEPLKKMLAEFNHTSNNLDLAVTVTEVLEDLFYSGIRQSNQWDQQSTDV